VPQWGATVEGVRSSSSSATCICSPRKNKRTGEVVQRVARELGTG
jgi:hypothetical protein